MNVIRNPRKEMWASLTKRPAIDNSGLDKDVRAILDEVRSQGDEAIRRLGQRFDRTNLDSPRVKDVDLAAAEKQLTPGLRDAILFAADNIRRFHAARLPKDVSVETQPGVRCWTKAVPIERVGLYVPGGSAPLFSTVLMLAIPAQLAGCREVMLCTPPNPDGSVHPAVLFAAKLCGIRQVLSIGGAQAIAAMAYGTSTIERVDKIVGPGNQFVTRAKQLVSLDGTAIDFPAGPSEVLIVADATANPAFVAADLLSQAEHGTDSLVIVVLLDDSLESPVQAELNQQLEKLPRNAIAQKALENGAVITFPDSQVAMEFCNYFAPEHLIINTADPAALAGKILNAGSVFLGQYSPESAGDYAAGTNHSLPTSGYARAFGGVTCSTFMKEITFQQLTREGLGILAPAIINMAVGEQLEAHANAIRIRTKS